MGIRMRFIICTIMILSTTQTNAALFLRPAVGVGFNSVQGTFYHLGVDLGVHYDENWDVGVGAFYAFGAQPDHDREIGGGPFVAYAYPLTQFLTLQARQDLDYVDQRNPILNGPPPFYTHDSMYGLESATYGGIQIEFTQNFGLALGYRLVVGLSNSSLSDGRSGAVVGIIIGF